MFSPQLQPVPQAPPAPAPAYAAPASGRRRQLILAGVAGLVVIVVAVLLYGLLFNKHISAQDVSNAQQYSDSVFSDINDSSLAFNEASDADSTSAAQSKLDLAQTKLTDAENNYTKIKKSNVLHDGTVKQKFNALNAKWSPYVSFQQNGISDSKTLVPIVIKFGNDIDALTQNAPTDTTGLASYLDQFKSTVDSTSSQLKSTKQTLSEDKQLVSALQAFLNTASQDIATAQSDLASGKDVYTVEDDVTKIDDASNTFSDKADSIQSQLDDHQKKLDPSNELNSFQTALDNLSTKVQSKK